MRGAGRLKALFACMYFAGLRPAEVMSLRKQNCHLPEEGWGRLNLSRSLPSVGSIYTDDGATHDDKGLKRRPKGEVRPVPIPQELVAILREHLEEFGTTDDGRLFATSTGGVVSAAAVCRIWEDARMLGLTPEQQLSPLAGRPYDLRHACATMLLNAGVPPKEVARRLGHSVDVLWKVYAGCMDGDEERINRLIEKAHDT
jgi:integrase